MEITQGSTQPQASGQASKQTSKQASEREASEQAIDLRELERLILLRATDLLDTPAEESFDRFTRLASSILQTPVALVSLVDQNRQYFKSCIGLPAPWATSRQTPLSHSFCQHVVSTAEPLVVADARLHPLVKDNLAIAELGVIAYLGIPLTVSEGHVLGALCVIDTQPREWTSRDIETLKELAALVVEQIELRLLATRLHTDYLKLRQLELFREEAAQMLVHDLRNPLTSFLGALELTETAGSLTSTQQRYLAVAQTGGETLSRMIDSLLEISDSDLTQLELTLSEVEPAGAIALACQQLSPLADKARVSLTYEIADNTVLMVDSEKLCRVLVNLISNGIQHTPPGGLVTVRSQTERSQTERSQTGQRPAAHFSVTDTGHGIPAAAFDHIFQKFSHLKAASEAAAKTASKAASKTTSIEGSGKHLGLGLSFSRLVVEAHGGRIWLESELGRGTTFHFTIPQK
ncbi:MAG: HAMP domain-containing sensor histidine kinase [Phormidesmis sp.]